MQDATDLNGYKKAVGRALCDVFLRQAMDNFAVAYRAGRDLAFQGLDVDALVQDVVRIKDEAIAHLDELLAQFTRNAAAAGVQVHVARSAEEANATVAGIARANGARAIIKSKSMTAEEIQLNAYLEARQFEVTETDLGEWIVQLRHEGPSHMVMPAIHLSRRQVADLFSQVTGQRQPEDIERLVKVARRELRRKFAQADMGISGANFAIARSGTLGLITNEGNARLVTTLPRVHVALVGLEKLLPTLGDALRVLRVLPRNATGQALTSYVSWISGACACAAAPDGRKQLHVVFLDNGRRALAADPTFAQVLRCVRCGACANVCPIYRVVGGHQYGHIYIGAIGLILTHFFHGQDKARHLVQNCINCGACKSVCAAGIDLPLLIKAVQTRIINATGHPIQSSLLARVLEHRGLFHALLRSARQVQKPVTGGSAYLRHLPLIFAREQNFRVLPAIAKTCFRERWPAIRPKPVSPRYRVALFAGCVQDFVYPEQLEAAVRLLAGRRMGLDFPREQTCCGLPLSMMSESASALAVARQNIRAFESVPCDYIVTLCASCAAHLARAYPHLLAEDDQFGRRAVKFAEKVVPFSDFMERFARVSADQFNPSGRTVTWHAPCHLCRGLGIVDTPRRLIETAGFAFTPAAEEQTCCGFGGTYSSKFPRVSAEILETKLADVARTGGRDSGDRVSGLRDATAGRCRPTQHGHRSAASCRADGPRRQEVEKKKMRSRRVVYSPRHCSGRSRVGSLKAPRTS